jgi:hypothetical protein
VQAQVDRIKEVMVYQEDRQANSAKEKTKKHNLAQLMLMEGLQYWMLQKVLNLVLIDLFMVGH